jgi:hypothetical protein
VTLLADCGGMHNLHRHSTYIDTITTRHLRLQAARVLRGDPRAARSFDAVRAGDEAALMGLIRAVQAGDPNAPLVAIQALLPRLCQVVISRLPNHEWKRAIDDYVTLAYLVMLDVSETERLDYLADKIIARTRRRHERQLRAARPERECLVPDNDNLVDPADIEVEVINRLGITRVAQAVDEGVLRPDQWQLIVSAGVTPREGARTPNERQAIARARRRLLRWYEHAQAA